jgi:hypothetical protein
MLVNAMEVGGVKGTFKVTSENVMRVLRDNKESVLALLEAFVHDPLISWRLVADDASEQKAPDASEHETAGQMRTQPGDVRNQRALEVVRRIQNKLNGRDFNPQVSLSVPAQIQRLVQVRRQGAAPWCRVLTRALSAGGHVARESVPGLHRLVLVVRVGCCLCRTTTTDASIHSW